MKTLEKIKFVSLEFDFGAEGYIDAEVFVEVNIDGVSQGINHKLQLHEVSFNDFLKPDTIEEITKVGDNFSTFIQIFRKLIALKVASDLGLEVVDGEYTTVTPTRELVKSLEISQTEQDELIMTLLLGGR